MLTADERDYKRGFKKHLAAYRRLKDENGESISRKLLLVYCVECGLKAELLKKWNLENPNGLLKCKEEELDPDNIKRKKILYSHDLEGMLKEVGQLGNFKLDHFQPAHREPVSPAHYHELYRYGIGTFDRDRIKEKNTEKTLEALACWIDEG